MRCFNFLLGFVLVVGCAPPMFAGSIAPLGDTTLQVDVVDADGASVSGADIFLSRRDGELRLQASSSADGRAQFLHLSRGTYWLSARGYAEALRVVIADQSEISARLLVAVPTLTEAVTVTASRSVESRGEQSKSLTVIGDDELEFRNEYSITEGLRSVPGLRIQQLGGPGSFVSVKTRGLRNEDTAFLVDGARLRDVAAPQGDASGFLEMLVSTDIESIEIVRGAGSAVHGSHAGGGVINIITKRGGGEPGGSLLAEAGGLGLLRGRGQIGGGLSEDRLSYSVGVSSLYVADGIDGDDAHRNTNVQGRVQLRVSPTTHIAANLYASSARLALNESPESLGSFNSDITDASPPSAAQLEAFESGTPSSALSLDGANFIPAANDPDSRRESSLLSTGINVGSRLGESIDVLARYHGLFTDRAFIDGPAGVSAFEPVSESTSTFDGNIQTMVGQLGFDWGARQRLLVSYELERESFQSLSLPGDGSAESGVDVVQRHQSLFLQDQLDFWDRRLLVVGSARGQFFSLSQPNLFPADGAPFQSASFDAPEAALVADFATSLRIGASGNTKLRAHVGSGYRAPSLFERFGASFSSFGYSVFGDPRLSSEKSLAFDVGVDHELDSGVRVSATFFRTRLRDIIVFDFSGAIDPSTDPFGRFGGYLSAKGGTSRGVELEVDGTLPGGLRLASSYSYTDSEAPLGRDDSLPQAFVIPVHQFSLFVNKALTSSFAVNFDLWATGSHLAPIFNGATFTSPVLRFEGVAKADVAVHWTAPSEVLSMRLFTTIENLFDQGYYESGFATVGRTARAGLSVGF